ncbi:MAG: hypothetical protein ACLQDV_07885 [Candidatus Binataceae bacterium]
MANEISRLQAQLEEAETDLQQSLSEVNQRVEAVGPRRRAKEAIREHPIATVLLGAAAGFALGSTESPSSLIGTLALGMFLGFEFAKKGEDADIDGE